VKIIIQKPKQPVFCIEARVIKNKTHTRERKQTPFFLYIHCTFTQFCSSSHLEKKCILNTSQIQRVRMQSNEEEIEEERIIIIAQ
jgi:hypothetical protein